MPQVPRPEAANVDMSWFVQDRFGMFIHWGLYALPARHEWVKQREEIADADYQKYFDHFNPDLYDPQEWARMAAAAGMKYFVITTKHHEGFCLWDSKHTEYKVTNTPYGKDLLHPMVDAFREAGLKVGFYHSLIDWQHPEYKLDWLHARRNDPALAELNTTRDQQQYATYLHNQVRELLTDFGQIDILWFDFSYAREQNGLWGKGKDDWRSEELVAMIRELQPNVILNNRLDLPRHFSDIYTPEQVQPREWVTVDGEPVYWETCQTFSGSWGYHRDEQSWKSPGQLIRMLVNSVSCGGNLLMNVGPTARGTFDERAREALYTYAEWMELHERSIYGCTQSEFDAPQDCRLTQNGKRLYCHVFAWPFRFLHLDGLAGKVEYAQLLNDGSEVKMHEADHFGPNIGMGNCKERQTLSLELPVKQPDVEVPVIELFLK